MTDLDTRALRRALRAPQEPGYLAPGQPGPADVAEIITRGRRLRWRRRAMAAGGSVCLAAAVVGAVAGIGRLTTPSPGPAQHVISPVGRTRATAAPSPSPGRPRATPRPSPFATAAATPSPTPTAAVTALPTPTSAQTFPTPTPTRSAGASISPSTGVSTMSPPTPSAASTQGKQPSAGATPLATHSGAR